MVIKVKEVMLKVFYVAVGVILIIYDIFKKEGRVIIFYNGVNI